MIDSLYGRLKELENSDFYPFHMPGHKRNFPEGILPAWYSMDITEIDGFDNLHQPQGILLSSQQKAARLYHADETFFLINGGTSGVLSALSAVLKKGKKVLLSRNSHISAYHSAYLNDMDLEYLYPDMIESYGIAAGIDTARVEERIRERNDIGAVFMTSPTYEGVVSDIRGIAEAAHRHQIPLIVDQAHGAHFGFHPKFPENAVDQGADLVIHSVHKTLPAPTQTALLHVKGNRVDREVLKRYLRMFQSTSPSYPLMAGIDYCMDLLRDQGPEMLENLLKMRHDFEDMTKNLRHFILCDKIDDPAKAVIFIDHGLSRGSCFTGRQLAAVLKEKYHLELEMVSENYVTAIFSIMDKWSGMQRLAEALYEIDHDLEEEKQEITGGSQKNYKVNNREMTEHAAEKQTESTDCDYQNHPLDTVMKIKEALDGMSEEISVEEAAGRITAEFIFLYPPGIPIAVPGERLDKDILEMLDRYRSKGLTIHGISQDDKISVVCTL